MVLLSLDGKNVKHTNDASTERTTVISAAPSSKLPIAGQIRDAPARQHADTAQSFRYCPKLQSKPPDGLQRRAEMYPTRDRAFAVASFWPRQQIRQ